MDVPRPADFHRLLRELGEVHDAELAVLGSGGWSISFPELGEVQMQSPRSQDPVKSRTSEDRLALAMEAVSDGFVGWRGTSPSEAEDEGMQPPPHSGSQSNACQERLGDELEDDGVVHNVVVDDLYTWPTTEGLESEKWQTEERMKQAHNSIFKLYKEWRDRADSGLTAIRLRQSCQLEIEGAMLKRSRMRTSLTWSAEAARIQYFPIRPHSHPRAGWEFVSILLLFCDIVIIPLQFFDLAPPYSYAMFQLVFWTLDIAVSFITGYHREDGKLELRFYRITMHYLKTWFIFDVLIVSNDWVAQAIIWANGDHLDSSGLFRIAKTLRLFRNLRASRLLRIIKVRELLVRFFETSCSQSISLVYELVLSVTSYLVLTHFVACMWFFVGSSEPGMSWVKKYELTHSDAVTQYAYAYHWSITQFTPASMEVFPQNTKERVFAVVIIIFALVGFSSFVSSTTSGMTQLRMLRSGKSQRLYTLRKFLRENEISGELSMRISRHIAMAIRAQKKYLAMQDVQLLGLASKTLQFALQKEMFSAFLSKHTFFNELIAQSQESVQELFDVVLQRQTFAAEDVLFNAGDAASRMHFVVRGTVEYWLPVSSGFDGKVAVLKHGAWLSEAALWMPWVHRGEARIVQDSDVALLSARKFLQVAIKDPDMRHLATSRAHAFLEMLSNTCNIHDAPTELMLRSQPSRENFRATQSRDCTLRDTMDTQSSERSRECNIRNIRSRER